ncbi:Uu.00g022960.m01.CDS01 [Anthostomella pinea]|uniref:Uu.00g022960.m01.CDS01 n=1 Tax=Anthostomella pinea TaxID=933095 RepID=A0AAI8YNW9_9PEZI|nr:Uu.00g022960.m01.CDS01 [Anthostomella pinea]
MFDHVNNSSQNARCTQGHLLTQRYIPTDLYSAEKLEQWFVSYCVPLKGQSDSYFVHLDTLFKSVHRGYISVNMEKTSHQPIHYRAVAKVIVDRATSSGHVSHDAPGGLLQKPNAGYEQKLRDTLPLSNGLGFTLGMAQCQTSSPEPDKGKGRAV